ncbi:MAG: EI24 domain-containing protein [Desulfotalea sp.]
MKQNATYPPWISIFTSISFIFKKKNLLGWSLLLSVVTIISTWICFSILTSYIDSFSNGLFQPNEAANTWLATLQIWFYSFLKWFYYIGTRIIGFYISFLIAYSVTSPGYYFLSHAAEKIYAGDDFDPDAALNLKGFLIDLWEGIKIALLGIIVSIFALSLNFLPLFGQLAILLVYTLYSTLIFIDYSASRRRWSLRKKINWVRNNLLISIRIGILPAFASLIPVLNIFFMALLFPIMTVHATLNFSQIIKHKGK